MKLLVLCVDVDDDLGKKAKIKGPVIGKEANIKAAEKLAGVDPEDSDINAIFYAVKIANEDKDVVDVVTLTGDPSRGHKAGKKISEQLDKILKKYEKIEGVVFVSDGADDDQILPIIQSKVKIVSKKTVIVRQQKELEKSYYVIKQALKDPVFSRILFGLPGIIILTIFLFGNLGIRAIAFVIGLYLIIRGFGIEDTLINSFRHFRETTSMDKASFPIYMGSLVLLLLAVISAYYGYNPDEKDLLKQWSIVVNSFFSLFTVSVILFILARIVDYHYSGEYKPIRKLLSSIVSFISLWILVMATTDLIIGNIDFNGFIQNIVIAFLVSFVGIFLARRIYKNAYIYPRVQKGMEVRDVEGNLLGKVKNKTRKAIVLDKGKQVPMSRVIEITNEITVKL